MANLTEEHIRTVFDLFDADGSGYVEADDLGLCLRALGFGDLPHEEIDAYAAEVVVDGNTRIEYPDFRKLIKAHMAIRDTPQEVTRAFRLFDKHSRGSVRSDDFSSVCREVGLLREEAPAAEKQALTKTIGEIIREANIAFPVPPATASESATQPTATAAATSSDSTQQAALGITAQQWSKVMHAAVTDKRRKLDDSAYSLKTRARVAKKGPFGVKVEAGKTYYWCSCGMSKTQPYCDGSHAAFNRDQGTSFAPVKYVAEDNRTVWFCGCKQTKQPPFCDGSHTNL